MESHLLNVLPLFHRQQALLNQLFQKKVSDKTRALTFYGQVKKVSLERVHLCHINVLDTAPLWARMSPHIWIENDRTVVE